MKHSLLLSALLLTAVTTGCIGPEPYCALSRCDDGGIGNDAGTLDGGPVDSGVPDGGYATLTGSAAFTVKTARAFARLLPDGGPDFSRVDVSLASVSHPCQHPMNPLVGPGVALVLEGRSADGGTGAGTFASTGSNTYLVSINPDGGAPLDVEFAGTTPGSFTFAWGTDPTTGVTGTVNVAFADAGTISGSFGASYCGAY